MLVDIESGREPELDPLVGAVIEIARLVGVDTPRLELAYASVRLLDRTRPAHATPEPAPAAARRLTNPALGERGTVPLARYCAGRPWR